MKKILLFGVFDGIHDGHRSLFRQAKDHGDYLVVAAAQDHIVRQLKGKFPQRNIVQRIAALEAERLVDEVVPGDDMLGAYDIVLVHRPDVIAFGYDQSALRNDLENALPMFWKKMEFVTLEPHKPKEQHSSLLSLVRS